MTTALVTVVLLVGAIALVIAWARHKDGRDG